MKGSIARLRLRPVSPASVPIPPTGEVYLFTDSADGETKVKDDAGVVVSLQAAGSAPVFPVGYIYSSTDPTDPGTLFGYGTWTPIVGRVIVSVNPADADFDTPGETGGSKTVAAAGSNAAESSHTHTYTQVPNHVHVQNRLPTATGAVTGFTVDTSMSGTPASTGVSTADPTGGVATGTTNGGSSHNHAFTGTPTSVVQPYFVAYVWERTA